MLLPRWIVETAATQLVVRMHLYWSLRMGEQPRLYAVEACVICVTTDSSGPALAVVEYSVRPGSNQVPLRPEIEPNPDHWQSVVAKATENGLWKYDPWHNRVPGYFSESEVDLSPGTEIEGPKDAVTRNLYRLLGALGELKCRFDYPAVLVAMEHRLPTFIAEYTRPIRDYYRVG